MLSSVVWIFWFVGVAVVGGEVFDKTAFETLFFVVFQRFVSRLSWALKKIGKGVQGLLTCPCFALSWGAFVIPTPLKVVECKIWRV